MIIPLNDWGAIITSNPVLNLVQCENLRVSFNAGIFNDVRIQKVFEYAKLVDFVNSDPIIVDVFYSFIKNYLFDDDPTPQQEADPNFIYDVITVQKGNFIEREIYKIPNLPVSMINQILIRIGQEMGGCNSNKLLTAINALNN